MAEAEDDPMFGKIVKGAQAWHKHQQDIAHASAGVDTEDDDDET